MPSCLCILEALWLIAAAGASPEGCRAAQTAQESTQSPLERPGSGWGEIRLGREGAVRPAPRIHGCCVCVLGGGGGGSRGSLLTLNDEVNEVRWRHRRDKLQHYLRCLCVDLLP